MFSSQEAPVPEPTPPVPAAQQFWLYKRGQLVLTFSSAPGVFVPSQGPLADDEDPHGWMQACGWASGQFMSVEWEPRVRRVLRRADDLVELIELLEDRRYEVDLEPPSKRVRHFRWL